MAIKRVDYNFFQITPKKKSKVTPKEIQQCLIELLNKSADTFQRSNVNGKAIFMHKFQKMGTYFMGTLVSASPNNLAGKVNLDTLAIERLNLGDQEGLEKHCTFLVDPQANILLLEKCGISSTQLCSYLSFSSSLPKVETALLINPSEIQKFYQMSTITKFSVKVARTENGDIFKEVDTANLDIDQVLDSADDTNTDELIYTIGVTNPANKSEKKSLNKVKITNFIKGFLGFKETQEVKELKVTGEYTDEDGYNRIVPLDLIKERLHDFFEMEVDRHSTIFSVEQKYAGLEKIYAKHRQAVINTYRSGE